MLTCMHHGPDRGDAGAEPAADVPLQCTGAPEVHDPEAGGAASNPAFLLQHLFLIIQMQCSGALRCKACKHVCVGGICHAIELCDRGRMWRHWLISAYHNPKAQPPCSLARLPCKVQQRRTSVGVCVAFRVLCCCCADERVP